MYNTVLTMNHFKTSYRLSTCRNVFIPSSQAKTTISPWSRVWQIPSRSFSDSGGEKGDRLTNILIRAVNSRPRPRPKFTPEEYAKHYEYGRNYVIGRFQMHNEINHDLACKIRLKEHTIRMMPRKDDKLGYLREKALEVDDSDESMPPMYRPIPVDTPPVEGYDVSQFVARED